MFAYAIADAFGIENLKLQERRPTAPVAGEVRVRMRAVSLNFRDIQVMSGLRDVPRPLVPLSDACAEVVEIGEGVTRAKVGDRVMPVFVTGWISGRQPADDRLATLGGPLDGTLQEGACWHERNVVAVPAHLTDAEAAALPCAAVSAWNALFVATHTKAGDVVVLQGTGGVSTFALQFAKLAGAVTVVLSSSDEKLARARTLGADFGVNYTRTPEWGQRVRELAGDCDCVVEVGGSRTFEQSLACLRNAGHISIVGFLSGTAPQFDLGEISRKGIGVKGIRVGNRDSFEAMCRAIGQARLRPVIDHVGPFSDAIDILKTFRDGSHFGKVCIEF